MEKEKEEELIGNEFFFSIIARRLRMPKKKHCC